MSCTDKDDAATLIRWDRCKELASALHLELDIKSGAVIKIKHPSNSANPSHIAVGRTVEEVYYFLCGWEHGYSRGRLEPRKPRDPSKNKKAAKPSKKI